MRRTVFNEDHEAFRQTLRAFIEAEVGPAYPDWLAAGIVPRDFYHKLAGLGLFAIAMTEPGTGSDLAGMRSTATLSADGSHHVLNGAKTFITGGVHAGTADLRQAGGLVPEHQVRARGLQGRGGRRPGGRRPGA